MKLTFYILQGVRLFSQKIKKQGKQDTIKKKKNMIGYASEQKATYKVGRKEKEKNGKNGTFKK